MARPKASPREERLAQVQKAAILRARGMTNDDIAAEMGVTRMTIHRWLTGPDSGSAKAVAQQVAEQTRAEIQAQAVVAANVVPIRPGIQTQARMPAPEQPVTLEDQTRVVISQALQVMQTAVNRGDVKAAMWILDRLDPERFGTASDKATMAELRKAADEANRTGRRVVVKISTPKRRDAEAATADKTGTEA